MRKRGAYPNQFLGVDVLEWYYPSAWVRQQKKR